MIDDTFVFSLGVGIAVLCAVYMALHRPAADASQKRAAAVLAAVIGFIVAWSLRRHPDQLEPLVGEITSRGIAVLLAALTAALVFWRARSCFL